MLVRKKTGGLFIRISMFQVLPKCCHANTVLPLACRCSYEHIEEAKRIKQPAEEMNKEADRWVCPRLDLKAAPYFPSHGCFFPASKTERAAMRRAGQQSCWLKLGGGAHGHPHQRPAAALSPAPPRTNSSLAAPGRRSQAS